MFRVIAGGFVLMIGFGLAFTQLRSTAGR